MIAQILRGPLARRLVLNFVLLALIAVAIALAAVMAVQFTSDTLLHVSARVDTALLSARIRSESLTLTELVRRYTLPGEAEPNLRQDIAVQQARLDALIQQAINAADPNDAAESMALGRVRQFLIAFRSQADRVLTAFDAERQLGPATTRELNVLVKDYQEPLVEALSDFEGSETRHVQQMRDQSRHIVQALLTTLSIVTLAVLALAAYMSRDVVVRIATPLTRLRQGVEQIRQGRLEQPVLIQRQDEMGELAEALNTMSADVRQYQERLEDLVRERTEELAAANRLLQQGEEYFRRIFEANPFPLVLTRQADSTVVTANQAAADYVEIALPELLVTQLLPYYANPLERQAVLEEMQAHGRVVNRLLEFRARTGAHKYALANVFPIDLSGEACLLTGLADITERKRVEEAEREQRTLAEALRDTAAVLTSTLELNDVLDHIMEEEQRVVPGDAAAIYMIEGDLARAFRWYVHGQPDHRELEYLAFTIGAAYNLQQMLATGEPLVIPDTHGESRWVRLPGVEWIRSYVGAPLRVRGQAIGIIEVDSATAGFFTPRDAERLRAFADQAAIAISNAQLFDETRRRAEHMATLNRIGLTITAGLDIDHVLRSLYEQCQQVVAADSFYVALYDVETGLIHFPLFRDQGRYISMDSHDIQTRPGLTGHVIQTRQTLYLPDTFGPGAAAFQIIRSGGTPARSFAGVPLILRDEVLGVLSVQSYQPNAYSLDQIRLLETIATQAAVAIENARLYTEARKAKEAAEAANAELLIRNQELDAFAHTVAHDLKNPIGLILGHAELLAEAYADLPLDQIRDSASIIARGADKLDNIIEELMLLAGVRKQVVKIEPLDMGEIISEALQRLSTVIREKEAQITWRNVEAWPKALGYAPWVEAVWANYISNAIKYGGTPSAAPHVELGATFVPPASDGDERRQVRFWARDNGRGLTPEQQSKLFAQFERLEQTRATGHGLGLSTVRRIVEKLGGQVGVESQVGQGSTFYFTLPAVPKTD